MKSLAVHRLVLDVFVNCKVDAVEIPAWSLQGRWLIGAVSATRNQRRRKFFTGVNIDSWPKSQMGLAIRESAGQEQREN